MVRLITYNAEFKTGVKERSGTFKMGLSTIKLLKGPTEAANNSV